MCIAISDDEEEPHELQRQNSIDFAINNELDDQKSIFEKIVSKREAYGIVGKSPAPDPDESDEEVVDDSSSKAFFSPLTTTFIGDLRRFLYIFREKKPL